MKTQQVKIFSDDAYNVEIQMNEWLKQNSDKIIESITQSTTVDDHFSHRVTSMIFYILG